LEEISKNRAEAFCKSCRVSSIDHGQREEGIDIGEQTAVLALLKSKFGVLEQWEQEQVKRLVGEIGLEATIARILTAQSVAEVFSGEN
jgi:hypothetical protein